MPAHQQRALRLLIFLDLAKPVIVPNQSPKTNRQTPSRGNFHIAAADQHPRP
jgi:hypothetical protein